MTGKTMARLTVVGLALSILLWTPAPGQAQGKWFKQVREMRQKQAKEMNLSPEKTKGFLAVEAKYDKIRRGSLEKVQNFLKELQTVLTAKSPDEAKVKGLVSAITTAQAEFINTYKARQDEVMALLTPVQQGKYLVTTWTWFEHLKGKYHHGKYHHGKKGEK
jgi:Spy/CpxP family protein refolding chaperone